MAKNETETLIDSSTLKLNSILAAMQKKYGNEAIMLPSKGSGSNIEWIPTDSPEINSLLGYGIPRGRMIEIFGPESSGKTTFAEFLVATIQKAGLIAAYIDLENALDYQYAKTIGMDPNITLISQPDSAEDAMNILKDLIEQDVDIAIVDSTDALVPQAEQEANFEDNQMALRARLLSKVCRNITPLMRKHKTTVLWISQVRAEIGSMSKDKVKSSVSNAIKFYCSIRIKCTSADPIMGRGPEPIGMTSRLKTVKNKLVAPGRIRTIEHVFGKGYQTDKQWIVYATIYNVIKKTSAAWFQLPSGEKVNGMDRLIEIVQADPEFKKQIIAETKKRMDAELEAPMVIGAVVPDGKTIRIVEEPEPEEETSYSQEQKDEVEMLVNAALVLEIIEKKGAGWFVCPGNKKIQGFKPLVEMVRNDPDLMAELQTKLSGGVEVTTDSTIALPEEAPILADPELSEELDGLGDLVEEEA